MLGPLEDLPASALLMSTPKDEGILLGGVRSGKLPPGRGTLVARRRGNEVMQGTYLPPL